MRLLLEVKFESDDGSVSVQSKTRVRCSHGEVGLGITMPARRISCPDYFIAVCGNYNGPRESDQG